MPSMADNSLKRYLDAGIAFTALTQAKAESIVRDLVKTGEVQTEQAQAAVNDLLDRSRANTERIVELVRNEVTEQVKSMGLVGQAELSRLEKRIEGLTGVNTATAVRKVAGKKAAATRAEEAEARSQAAKKAALTRKENEAKEAAVRKVAGQKAAATRAKKATGKKAATKKKAAAKKAPAKKKAAAKKAPAKKKAASKKAPAKKTAAKKA